MSLVTAAGLLLFTLGGLALLVVWSNWHARRQGAAVGAALGLPHTIIEARFPIPDASIHLDGEDRSVVVLGGTNRLPLPWSLAVFTRIPDTGIPEGAALVWPPEVAEDRVLATVAHGYALVRCHEVDPALVERLHGAFADAASVEVGATTLFVRWRWSGGAADIIACAQRVFAFGEG